MTSRSPAPTFSHRLEYIFGAPLLGLLGRLPRVAKAPMGCFLARIWYHLLPIRRRVVLENLKRAFPKRDAVWRAQIARKCLAHFVHMMIFDFQQIRREKRKALRELIDHIESVENFPKPAGKGKSCILLGAHLGNWELGASYYASIEAYPLQAVAKPLHNPLFEKVLAASRSACGWSTISTHQNPMPEIIRTIREGKVLVLLGDQNARKEGIFVPFFGHLASTTAGPATLAQRYKIPIVFSHCLRSAKTGHYTIRFSPPLYPNPEAKRQEEIRRLTEAHVNLLENSIREAPEQYFWFHQRWKTRPKTERKN